MELKEYQRSALDAFSRWREALDEASAESAARVATLEAAGQPVSDGDRDFPRMAWERLADWLVEQRLVTNRRPHVDRRDDAGRPIPHACFRIPTGGGKTLLGAAALERLDWQTGLVLWIVPNKAIYAQTRKALRTREHPCRQWLERASGGRVKMLEKEDRFTRDDADNHLCVMLLMLPAANRNRDREFLRMFRDSGRYPGFFPDPDDARANAELAENHPDLERSGDGLVKRSLGNVIRLLRPVVVLDEAHRAYGGKGAVEFVRAVNRLSPRLVLELSATPNARISNLLVEISGIHLKAAEMIKLPVEVAALENAEWGDALRWAHDRLDELDAAARSLEASEGRYVRPIAVVRVERTGKGQQDAGRIHAEDVRQHLVEQLGVGPEAVRVKSAERDEIGDHDLLSAFSPVRWIITKDALREGWDCPFAYVLVVLDNTRSETALTQLMGRVMRQPDARRTGRDALDRCYVVCRQTGVRTAIKQVTNGLEHEGLSGLAADVTPANATPRDTRTVRRRDPHRNRKILLPKVLHRDAEGEWRELDYQRHILPAIPWGSLAAPAQSEIPDASDVAAVETIGLDVGSAGPGNTGQSPAEVIAGPSSRETIEVDATAALSWFTHHLKDLVPNPWQAARIVEELLDQLRGNGIDDDRIHAQRRTLAHSLKQSIAKQIENLAERVFQKKLNDDELRFDLEAGDLNYLVPDEYALSVAANDRPLASHGQPVQRSLFDTVLHEQFDSDLERGFAIYLDQHAAIQWWHRVAMRQPREYYLRGWRPDLIWPDFVAMTGADGAPPKMLVVETKGKHLDNPDTKYKREVYETLERALNNGTAHGVGWLQVDTGPARGKFTIVFNEEEFAGALA